jgi:hypothetical protein
MGCESNIPFHAGVGQVVPQILSALGTCVLRFLADPWETLVKTAVEPFLWTPVVENMVARVDTINSVFIVSAVRVVPFVCADRAMIMVSGSELFGGVVHGVSDVVLLPIRCFVVFLVSRCVV